MGGWRIRLSSVAGRAAALAAYCLPPADRSVKAKEYQAELWELATLGLSRRAQWAHAARLVA
jgi:hypothetical protein